MASSSTGASTVRWSAALLAAVLAVGTVAASAQMAATDSSPRALAVGPHAAAVTTQATPLECESGSYSDVDTENVHAENICKASEEGLFQGTTPTTFEPAKSLSRGQMALVLDRFATEVGKPLADGPDAFDDDPEVYATALNRLAAAEVYKGKGPRIAAPDDPVSRGQMASLIVRLYEHLGGEVPAGTDAFSDDYGSVHEPALNSARAMEIYLGRDGLSELNNDLKRDQAASILVRAFERFMAEQDPTDPSDPSDPSDPGDPSDPSDPSGPSDPSDPGDPSDPSDPSDASSI